jgi:hypothetical protein
MILITSTPPSSVGVQSDHPSTMPMPRSGREARITKGRQLVDCEELEEGKVISSF